jgi:hypothetical protein
MFGIKRRRGSLPWGGHKARPFFIFRNDGRIKIYYKDAGERRIFSKARLFPLGKQFAEIPQSQALCSISR